jgi:hypothetical protein
MNRDYYLTEGHRGTSLRKYFSILNCVLRLPLAPNSQGLAVLFPPFPVVTLSDEILLLPGQAAAVRLRTDPR